MQNQDHCGSGLNSNSQRVLIQPSDHLNQSYPPFASRYQPNNSLQIMANSSSHHPSQATSYSLSSQVQSWANCEAQPNSHMTNQHGKLKVEDALSYLDQVKLKFGHQPQVYNEFLDIMKEFKSQAIDTPGVIDKVSSLFTGHMELIVGFNTFLPQGYCIEVNKNHTINVRQPGQQVTTLANFNNANPNQTHANANQVNQYHNPRPNEQDKTSQNANQFDTNQGQQPMQFNHAINYVNKIKYRYQTQPETYKAFLEILHNYQKEQKLLKEGIRPPSSRTPLTEAEVYSQVSVLFKDQPELLMEFRQFLPDASGGHELMKELSVHENVLQGGHHFPYFNRSAPPISSSSTKPSSHHKGGVSINSPLKSKSSSVTSSVPPSKKQKLSFQKSSTRDHAHGTDLVCHDAELAKIVRKVVAQNPMREMQCRDLLRHVDLLNRKLLDVSEFNKLANPMLEKIPELKSHIRSLLSKNDTMGGSDRRNLMLERLKESVRNEHECFPDLSTCPQYGKHYRILPSDYVSEKSSHRSDLTKNVLNETHAIYANALSETESDCEYTIKRNANENQVFQCEDERYEMDMVIDLNSSVLRGLRKLMPKIQKMGSEDLAKYHIEDLGIAIGVSEVHIETAMKRLYGEKFLTMMEGLKKCPGTAVPLVIKSMQFKDREWKIAKKSFERIWSEQIDKYYLKSLDFQGQKFKQSDSKYIRSKTLIKEIENLFDEHCNDERPPNNRYARGYSMNGPKKEPKIKTSGLRLYCKERQIYDDAVDVILSSVSRQSALQMEDQDRIRSVLINFLPSVLFASDHKKVKVEVKVEHDAMPHDGFDDEDDSGSKTDGSNVKVKREILSDSEDFSNGTSNSASGNGHHSACFYCNENWYVLVRLIVILCERLFLFKEKARELFSEEEGNKELRSDLMTSALQARCPDSLDPNSYYATFLVMVKNLANGLLELGSFEDQLREMFGINSYIAFTIDKVIGYIVKQLQHVTSRDECISLGEYYELAHKREWTSERYEQKSKDLMVDKSCFKLNLDKSSDGMVGLCYALIKPSSDDSQSSVKHQDAICLPSSLDAKCCHDDVGVGNVCIEASVGLIQSDLRGRKRRRKSSEVRGHGSKRLLLKDSAYSFRSEPDFIRKSRKLISKSYMPGPESTTKNVLVRALESMATSRPHPRTDYDNDTADHCLNEESSDGSQRMLHNRDGDKSEDDSSCSGSYRRFALRSGCTEVHVCRPGRIERARKNNYNIHAMKKRKFDAWKNKWDVDNLSEDVRSLFVDSTHFDLLDNVSTRRADQHAIDSSNRPASPQSTNQIVVYANPIYSPVRQSPCSDVQQEAPVCPASPTYSPASPSYSANPPTNQIQDTTTTYQSVRNENDISSS